MLYGYFVKQSQKVHTTTSFVVNTINSDKRSKTFQIEGYISNSQKLHRTKLTVYCDTKRLTCQPVKVPISHEKDGGQSKLWYMFSLPHDSYGEIRLYVISEANSEEETVIPLEFSQISRLSGRTVTDYRIVDGQLFIPTKTSLIVNKFSLTSTLFLEVKFFIESLRNTERIRRNTVKTIIVEVLRLLAIIRMVTKRSSQTWLFTDRSISGGDNSEVLFRYVSDQNNKSIRPYFAVQSDTPAYRRLRSDGYNVVKFRSLKHLYLAMTAEILLPSHLDMMYLYPWPGIWWKYSGLMQYSVVHTQHGIVLNDISDYVGKRQKNAQIFLSICEWEKKYLTNNHYGYSDKETPVTGAPRYDELDKDKTKNVVSIHPTWRSWLAGEEHRGHRKNSANFKDSDYYAFYQALLRDTRIIEALRKYDYTLRFYVHPNHRANRTDFIVDHERVELMKFPYDYSTMISESAVFVTDYSNILFDAAYLKKPIIHTQFDVNRFFSEHGSVKEQLFDYKSDGFGPVCSDYESAVQSIVMTIANGPVMEDKYQHRVDKFFTYNDRKNSERAYRAVRQFVSSKWQS